MTRLRLAASPVAGESWIHSGWYVEMTELASRTTWLNGPTLAYTSFGGLLFVALPVAAFWAVRYRAFVLIAPLLATPIAAIATYFAVIALKRAVAQ
ncbi:hypothetical protein [Nocardia sp. NPDC058633]|uniref:hypothetical protein n=1 Tax=Nocardia sp. NPDC058633 TaxID=3346568 RepID=UPI003649D565